MRNKERIKAKDLLKAKDIFKELRNKNVGWLTINTRLSLLVGGVVLGSILIAFGITMLSSMLFPTSNIGLAIQTVIFSLIVTMVATSCLPDLT